MKLIDADALMAYFEHLKGDTIAVTDAAAVADNAVPVCCAECKHEHDCAVPRAYREYWNHGGPMDKTVGCSYFERRTDDG